MSYKTVFQVSDKGFDLLLFAPLLLLVIGLLLLWFNVRYNKVKSPKRTYLIVFSAIFSGLALVASLLVLPATISDRNKTQKMFENNEFKVVEGKIEDFHPMPKGGHEPESFRVNGVYFEYSDFELLHGFNQTASHGGPLKRNGQQVRLSYITGINGNHIVKIELKE